MQIAAEPNQLWQGLCVFTSSSNRILFAAIFSIVDMRVIFDLVAVLRIRSEELELQEDELKKEAAAKTVLSS